MFASPPTPDLACNIVDESAPDKPCYGTIHGDDGKDVPFTTTQAGTYVFEAGAPKGKKIPLIAHVTIKDAATHKVVVDDAHDEGGVTLPAGNYEINVRDSVPGAAAHFKGGFSFVLSVKRTSVKAVPSAAPVASAGVATITDAKLPSVDKPVVKAAPPSSIVKGDAKAKDAGAPRASAAPSASPAAPTTSAKKK